MAEEAIENELNCSICLDTYTDPKILQCSHVYCRKCLVKLVIGDQHEQLSLSCPICRQVTPVPARGTVGLPSAFHVNRLLEIINQHKKAKSEAASTEEVVSKNKILCCCSEHDGREVELFCETCEELICYKCAVKGGKHHSHDYKNINESYEKYREEVIPSLEPLLRKLKTITTILLQLDRHCEKTKNRHAIIESEIRESSQRLHDIISNRQDQLINQLDQITKRKVKWFTTQRDQIKALQAQLSSCVEFTKESLKTDNQQHEALAVRTKTLKKIKELSAPHVTDMFTLNTEADVVFSGSADAAAMCESYGRVYDLASADPAKCTITGRGTEVAVVGKKTALALEAITANSEACNEASVSMSFQVELVSEITGGKVFGCVEHSIEQERQGQYVVSYQPTVKGMHQLHIKSDGQHISGSPFYVTVTLPVEKIGTPILTLSEVVGSLGVAVTGNGGVVVAEQGRSSLSVFNIPGKTLRAIVPHNSADRRVMVPSDVTVNGEGNILVLDSGNHCIRKFAADGSFLIKEIGSYGCESLQLNTPTGITYCARNRKVYVADTSNHRVQVLTPNLEFISMFGKQGSSKRQFNYPIGIASDSTGRVYVADSRNHRIQVLTAEGKFLKMFGKEGSGRGELGHPWGVGVDASGLVYVSENRNHRVSVFTSEGRFVTAFGSKGTGPGQFDSPCGLAVDDSGVVYVGDNHGVHLF